MPNNKSNPEDKSSRSSGATHSTHSTSTSLPVSDNFVDMNQSSESPSPFRSRPSRSGNIIPGSPLPHAVPYRTPQQPTSGVDSNNVAHGAARGALDGCGPPVSHGSTSTLNRLDQRAADYRLHCQYGGTTTNPGTSPNPSSPQSPMSTSGLSPPTTYYDDQSGYQSTAASSSWVASSHVRSPRSGDSGGAASRASSGVRPRHESVLYGGAFPTNVYDARRGSDALPRPSAAQYERKPRAQSEGKDVTRRAR